MQVSNTTRDRQVGYLAGRLLAVLEFVGVATQTRSLFRIAAIRPKELIPTLKRAKVGRKTVIDGMDILDPIMSMMQPDDISTTFRQDQSCAFLLGFLRQRRELRHGILPTPGNIGLDLDTRCGRELEDELNDWFAWIGDDSHINELFWTARLYDWGKDKTTIPPPPKQRNATSIRYNGIPDPTKYYATVYRYGAHIVNDNGTIHVFDTAAERDAWVRARPTEYYTQSGYREAIETPAARPVGRLFDGIPDPTKYYATVYRYGAHIANDDGTIHVFDTAAERDAWVRARPTEYYTQSGYREAVETPAAWPVGRLFDGIPDPTKYYATVYCYGAHIANDDGTIHVFDTAAERDAWVRARPTEYYTQSGYREAVETPAVSFGDNDLPDLD